MEQSYNGSGKKTCETMDAGIINICPLDRCFTFEILTMWNRSFSVLYHISEKMLDEKVFDDKDLYNEGSFLLFEDGKLAGMIIAKLDRNGLPEYTGCAWLSALVVDIGFRNKGYGKRLLHFSEERLKANRIKEIILGGDMHYFFSGIPEPTENKIAYFKDIGFLINDEEHYDLTADASKIDFNSYDVSINSDKRYFTAEMRRKDFKKLIYFFDNNFPGRWKHEIINYVNYGGDLKNVILLWDGEQVAGFCKISTRNEVNSCINAGAEELWAGLGPIGISDLLRGRNLGNKLLRDSLNFLKARGAGNIIIDWTILKNFYGQFGFKVYKTYRGASKLL